MIRAQTIY